MPRFVLLYHDCPADYQRPSHWDFMLEAGDMLRTWALEKLPGAWRTIYRQTQTTHPDCPALADGNQVAAQRLADHRCDFLEFEGELTHNRGRVTRVAHGTFVEEWETRDGWFLSLNGPTVNCQIELDDVEEDDRVWMLSVQERTPEV